MSISLPRLKFPIVFAHGLLGFGEMKLGTGRLRYFKDIPDHLESAGNRVLMSGVSPTGSIARRAEKLKANIIREFGESPVHVIAHSMGGLDARYMISHLDMAGRVATLTCVGTPHRGSSFADWICAQGERTKSFALLLRLGVDLDAFADLTRESCAEFNKRTPDAAGVRYFSIAGDKPVARTLYILRPSHKIIAREEGPNDGLVAIESARWGETFEIWDCDHVNLVGWTGPLERARGFFSDPTENYTKVIGRLHDTER